MCFLFFSVYCCFLQLFYYYIYCFCCCCCSGGIETAEPSVVGMESRPIGTESRSVRMECESSLKKPFLDIDNDQVYEEHKTEDVMEEDPLPTGGEDKLSHHKDTAISDLAGREGGKAGREREGDRAGREKRSSDKPLTAPSSPSSSSFSSVSSSLYPLPPPTAAVHQVPRPSRCGLSPQLYVAPPEDVGIKRRAAWGLNSCARENLVWHPDTGGQCSC